MNMARTAQVAHKKLKTKNEKLLQERGTRNEEPGFAGISFDELLSYAEGENRRWRAWFKQHPEALAVEAGIADAQNVYELLMHVFSVQMRFAELSQGSQMTPASAIRAGDIEQAFRLADQATAKLRALLAEGNKQGFEQVLNFPDGETARSATRRKLIAHAILHGVRHWAQIATALRKAGYPQTWPHDFLYSEAMK